MNKKTTTTTETKTATHWIQMRLWRLGTRKYISCLTGKHVFSLKSGNQWSWNNNLSQRVSSISFGEFFDSSAVIYLAHGRFGAFIFCASEQLWCVCSALFSPISAYCLQFSINLLKRWADASPKPLSPLVWVKPAL